MSKKLVAILGASDRQDRFAYKALRLLRDHGFPVRPVSPRVKVIEGVPVVATLGEISETIDTLTLYVGPDLSTKMAPEILALKPRRVIFNPGTENSKLEAELRSAGIEVVEDCTLVMLRAGSF